MLNNEDDADRHYDLQDRFRAEYARVRRVRECGPEKEFVMRSQSVESEYDEGMSFPFLGPPGNVVDWLSEVLGGSEYSVVNMAVRFFAYVVFSRLCGQNVYIGTSREDALKVSGKLLRGDCDPI